MSKMLHFSIITTRSASTSLLDVTRPALACLRAYVISRVCGNDNLVPPAMLLECVSWSTHCYFKPNGITWHELALPMRGKNVVGFTAPPSMPHRMRVTEEASGYQAKISWGGFRGIQAGLKAREEALDAALEDMCNWLDSAGAQVAIFDATNSTESRRQTLVRRHLIRCIATQWAAQRQTVLRPCVAFDKPVIAVLQSASCCYRLKLCWYQLALCRMIVAFRLL